MSYTESKTSSCIPIPQGMCGAIQINQEAYEAIESMDFEILDVLETFGSEVWENNWELYENFSEKEVAVAFVQHMLDQCATLSASNPVFT